MGFGEVLVASSAIIGGLSIAGVAIVLGIIHEWRKRGLEHIERLRALELGRTLPQDEPWLSPLKIGAAVAILVPIGAFLFACVATQIAGYHEPIWIAVTLVGLPTVISGSVLVASSSRTNAIPVDRALAKPYVEEDAYDVVSSRG